MLAILFLLLLLLLLLVLLLLILLLWRWLLLLLRLLPLLSLLFPFAVAFAFSFAVAGPLALVARRPRCRILRRPRWRGGVDLERLPAGVRDVRRLRPRVDRHGAVFEHAPRPRPEPLGHDPHASFEDARLLFGEQRDALLDRSAAQSRLDANACQAEIGIERPHADRHGRARGHPRRRFPRLLDRHFRGEIRDHLDAMLHRLDDLRLPRRSRGGPRPKHESIEGMRRARAVGVHLQRKRLRHSRQIGRFFIERQVVVAVAFKIDPGGIERLVAFGDDRHLRSLDGPDVALPFDGLRLPSGVGRIVVAQLAHEQRRRIDDRDLHRLTACIPRRDHDLDRLVEAAGGIGKRDGESLEPRRLGRSSQPRHRFPTIHLGLPRCRAAIDRSAGGERRDCHDRLLVAPQAADVCGDHELPATHERGRARLDDEPAAFGAVGVCIAAARLFAGHPPGKLERLNRHPRRRRPTRPRRKQPRRARDETLRRKQFIETCRPDEGGEREGQPQGRRAVDHALRRHVGKPLRGSPLERPHDHWRARLGMRLHEHSVDEVVVKFGVFALDGPRRIDEVDAIPHERHDPADDRGRERHEPRDEPCPADGPRQAARHDPVLHHDARRQPDERRDTRAQQERRQGHALVVGPRGGQTLREVTIRLRV